MRDVLHESGLDGRGWQSESVVPSLSDTVVIRVGPPGASAEAVVKIANSARGARSLLNEVANLETLSAYSRLAEWRHFLPDVFGEGELAGRRYLVEEIVPGVDGRRLVGRAETRRTLLPAAAAAIQFLHRVTQSEPTVVDDEVLRRCLDDPLAALHARVAQLSGETWRANALDRLGRLLRERLRDRRIVQSWVHGDLVPANIFATRDGAVITGLVDWDHARPDGIPALDLVQLVLATRVRFRRRELGQIVCELAQKPKLDEPELGLLGGEHELDLTTLVLLAWLDHVSGVLVKAERYARSWAWLRLNVDHVLHNLRRV